jgi:hypothetical protein
MSVHGPIELPSGRKVFQVRWREQAATAPATSTATATGKKLAGSFDKKICASCARPATSSTSSSGAASP